MRDARAHLTRANDADLGDGDGYLRGSLVHRIRPAT
jgi:hypothetical protein